MIFTDCDLKRFKLWTYDYFATDKFYCRTYEIIALLSRLEAAEHVIDRLSKCQGQHPSSEDDETYCESCGNVGWYCNSWIGPAISAWRKSKGE